MTLMTIQPQSPIRSDGRLYSHKAQLDQTDAFTATKPNLMRLTTTRQQTPIESD